MFQLSQLASLLEQKGFACRAGMMELDVHPMNRPYFEKWLAHRDGFLRMSSGNVDFVGVEEVVRMGPFFNVYFLVENRSVANNDDNAHRLLDAWPYFNLESGKITTMGWSGGVLADLLSKDEQITREYSQNIMKEEVRKLSVHVSDYCCVIESRAWDPMGTASIFGIVDRMAMHVRKLIKIVHLGEDLAR
ncbi:MAG: hypothetical protein ABI361_04670 [Nitrososphaera sp.]